MFLMSEVPLYPVHHARTGLLGVLSVTDPVHSRAFLRLPPAEGRCKATWKREFILEAGPPNHHDDKVDSDQ